MKKTKKVSQVGDHNHVAASASDASNERKFNSSEIEEYWVPVHLSHTQMEQYCSLLNSNFESLSSSLRDNSSLNGILTQTQKVWISIVLFGKNDFNLIFYFILIFYFCCSAVITRILWTPLYVNRWKKIFSLTNWMLKSVWAGNYSFLTSFC